MELRETEDREMDDEPSLATLDLGDATFDGNIIRGAGVCVVSKGAVG